MKYLAILVLFCLQSLQHSYGQVPSVLTQIHQLDKNLCNVFARTTNTTEDVLQNSIEEIQNEIKQPDYLYYENLDLVTKLRNSLLGLIQVNADNQENLRTLESGLDVIIGIINSSIVRVKAVEEVEFQMTGKKPSFEQQASFLSKSKQQFVGDKKSLQCIQQSLYGRIKSYSPPYLINFPQNPIKKGEVRINQLITPDKTTKKIDIREMIGIESEHKVVWKKVQFQPISSIFKCNENFLSFSNCIQIFPNLKMEVLNEIGIIMQGNAILDQQGVNFLHKHKDSKNIQVVMYEQNPKHAKHHAQQFQSEHITIREDTSKGSSLKIVDLLTGDIIIDAPNSKGINNPTMISFLERLIAVAQRR
jgi:hypothetical protein